MLLLLALWLTLRRCGDSKLSITAYIICATPRSGSTLLCDLLTGSGLAGEPHSYFRSEDISYWSDLWGTGEPTDPTDTVFNRAYLSAMVRAGTADTGIFGLRLMWQSVSEATDRMQAGFGSDADLPTLFEQQLGPTLFIHLSRRDKIAQAISLVRAQQTGLWHVSTDGSERERTGPGQLPVFDADEIARALALSKSADEEWVRFLDQHGITPLRLFYEDFAAQPQDALAKILTALGYDGASASAVGALTAKMADGLSLEWSKQMDRGRLDGRVPVVRGATSRSGSQIEASGSSRH